jgi:hypothetical protein
MSNVIVAHNGITQGNAINMVGSLSKPTTTTLVNSTIVSNAVQGINCSNVGLSATLINLIVWGNGEDLDFYCHASYSNIEDDDPGTGNLNLDPRFVGPEDNDFRLRYDSPCIDKGATPTTYTVVPGEDWEGDTRPGGSGYDMGADEFVPAYGARFIPALRSAEVLPGETVQYLHFLRNTGNVSDTFTVTLGTTQGWAITGSSTSPELGPYDLTMVTVEVSVPLTATDGMTDVAALRAISWSSPATHGLARDTTTVQWHKIYLPLVLREAGG